LIVNQSEQKILWQADKEILDRSEKTGMKIISSSICKHHLRKTLFRYGSVLLASRRLGSRFELYKLLCLVSYNYKSKAMRALDHKILARLQINKV
jgi:hypothetical protein